MAKSRRGVSASTYKKGQKAASKTGTKSPGVAVGRPTLSRNAGVKSNRPGDSRVPSVTVGFSSKPRNAIKGTGGKLPKPSFKHKSR